MGHDGRWVDDWASRAWSTSIGCEFARVADDATRAERRVQRADNERRLEEVAKRLAATDNTALFNLWNERWEAMDAEWRPRLRELRDWLLPRGLRARQQENAVAAAERAHRRAAARGVGGLSLARIVTIRELYQLQKAYAMRPTPRNLRQNIAGKGEDRFDEFGRSVLAVMERLREQRVKQISSRIVEAALGVGRLPAMRGRNMARPKGRLDRPCQVVVIENLKNYRPDEVQTRRENRALMNWSAAKVRKHLEESCQLHGVLMREVTPNYTSRQCSRTGRAGTRCADVSIDPASGCPRGVWWDKMLWSAKRKIDEGGGSALDRMIVDLARALGDAHAAGRKTPPSVRLPRQGGDLFVAAPAWNDIRAPRAEVGCVIQADLNAAANIGLRALLDPDFPGRWWYIPCSITTGQPGRDKCVGAACIDLSAPLLELQVGGERQSSGRGARGASSGSANREFMNAWGDPAAADLGHRAWRPHGAYWNDVTMRVVELLRTVNDLSKDTA